MLDKTHPQCPHCEEPIRPEDEQTTLADGTPIHMECLMRSVLGSIAHVQQRCPCFIPGSTEGDPPGMTRRQAARAAVEAQRIKSFASVLNVDGACPFCGLKEFHPGPSAGRYSHNIKCAECGAKFCYRPPFSPMVIYNDDVSYDLNVRQRLEQLPRFEGPPDQTRHT